MSGCVSLTTTIKFDWIDWMNGKSVDTFLGTLWFPESTTNTDFRKPNEHYTNFVYPSMKSTKIWNHLVIEHSLEWAYSLRSRTSRTFYYLLKFQPFIHWFRQRWFRHFKNQTLQLKTRNFRLNLSFRSLELPFKWISVSYHKIESILLKNARCAPKELRLRPQIFRYLFIVKTISVFFI